MIFPTYHNKVKTPPIIMAPIEDYRGFVNFFPPPILSSSHLLNNYQYFISNQCIDKLIH